MEASGLDLLIRKRKSKAIAELDQIFRLNFLLLMGGVLAFARFPKSVALDRVRGMQVRRAISRGLAAA